MATNMHKFDSLHCIAELNTAYWRIYTPPSVHTMKTQERLWNTTEIIPRHVRSKTTHAQQFY